MPFGAFVGVDFSAARDAGRRIWIARGRDAGGVLAIERCIPAAALPGGGAEPATAWAALRAAIAADTGALVALDLPFGMPAAVVDAADWTGFVAGFAADHADAAAFRAAMRRAAGGRELKRRTDAETRTPFCGWNIRMYRQSHAGIAHVIAPLIAAGAARAAPMQPAEAGRPVLVEACPASTLKAAGLYRPYKGAGAERAAARAAILDALVGRGDLLPPEGPIRAALLADRGGDALDAAICAATAFRASRDPTLCRPRDAVEAIEGRVFF